MKYVFFSLANCQEKERADKFHCVKKKYFCASDFESALDWAQFRETSKFLLLTLNSNIGYLQENLENYIYTVVPKSDMPKNDTFLGISLNSKCVTF